MEFMNSLISEGMDNRPAYGFSQKLRAAVEKDEVTPSPLEYYGDRVDLRASTKGFSFGTIRRFDRAKVSVTPGPGEYFIADDLKKKRRRKVQQSFGSRPSNILQESELSGSNAYFPQQNVEISFGNNRPKTGKRELPVVPRSEYYYRGPFLFKDTPAFTFGSRNSHRGRMELSDNLTPSPLDYRPEFVKAKSSPSFSFGCKTSKGRLFAIDTELPGPGEYDVDNSVFVKKKKRNQRKGFSFGIRFPTLIK